jgi:hypothetical protein
MTLRQTLRADLPQHISTLLIAGLDPAIQSLASERLHDRVKPGHEEENSSVSY